MERENVYVAVFDANTQYGAEDMPPINLLEFQEWLAERLAVIPEEFRETAAIQWQGMCSYGGEEADVKLTVGYWRPETDEEFAVRKQWLDANKRAREADERARELATLAALKRKYPEQP